MQRSVFVSFVAALALFGCGGSVSQDGSSSGGSGAQAGSAGTAGTSGSGGASTGGTAGTAGTSGSGGASTGGTAGTGGLPPYCCLNDGDCPQYFDTGPTECIEGVCKDAPGPGLCWRDSDCYGGQCIGASVCPCDMDCYGMDSPGKCTNGPEPCCTGDLACGGGECVANVCKPKPPADMCWRDSDCKFGTCFGASVCPCGADCDAPDQMGSCPVPGPNCCKTDNDCGDFQWMPCVNGVCKQPQSGGLCWVDAECPNGQKCIGATVCPCGAMCALMDTPGKCG